MTEKSTPSASRRWARPSATRRAQFTRFPFPSPPTASRRLKPARRRCYFPFATGCASCSAPEQQAAGTARTARLLANSGDVPYTGDILRSLRLAAQDVALSRRKQGFDSPRELSLIHISEPTRQAEISYAV